VPEIEPNVDCPRAVKQPRNSTVARIRNRCLLEITAPPKMSCKAAGPIGPYIIGPTSTVTRRSFRLFYVQSHQPWQALRLSKPAVMKSRKEMQDNIHETSAFSVQATSLKMLAAECNHRVVAAVKNYGSRALCRNQPGTTNYFSEDLSAAGAQFR